MFKMNKSIASLIAPLAMSLAAITSPAQAESPVRFIHAESGYSVKGWSKSDGTLSLRGVHADGSRFNITVTAKGRVTGTVKGEAVDYMLDAKTREELAMK